MSVTARCSFVLGHGSEGSFGEVEFTIDHSVSPTCDSAEELRGHPKLEEVETEILFWLTSHSESGRSFAARITKIGQDPERPHDVKRAVSLALHGALPELGIDPPPVFSGRENQ
jgi:hypothetical protein